MLLETLKDFTSGSSKPRCQVNPWVPLIRTSPSSWSNKAPLDDTRSARIVEIGLFVRPYNVNNEVLNDSCDSSWYRVSSESKPMTMDAMTSDAGISGPDRD